MNASEDCGVMKTKLPLAHHSDSAKTATHDNANPDLGEFKNKQSMAPWHTPNALQPSAATELVFSEPFQPAAKHCKACRLGLSKQGRPGNNLLKRQSTSRISFCNQESSVGNLTTSKHLLKRHLLASCNST